MQPKRLRCMAACAWHGRMIVTLKAKNKQEYLETCRAGGSLNNHSSLRCKLINLSTHIIDTAHAHRQRKYEQR
jgi:hypothetical protein